MDIQRILQIVKNAYDSEISSTVGYSSMGNYSEIIGVKEFYSEIERELNGLSTKIGDIEIQSNQKEIYIATIGDKQILIQDDSESSIIYAINKLHNYHQKSEGERYTDLYVEDLRIIGTLVDYKDCVSWEIVHMEIKTIKL